MIKLNIGCGTRHLEGYINIDFKPDLVPPPDMVMDCKSLSSFADNSVHEILGIHVFEHFHPHEAIQALLEYRRVLVPGGKLILELPDMKELCRNFVYASNDMDKYIILEGMYSTSTPWSPHKYGWDDMLLYKTLQDVGFTHYQREEPRFWFQGYNMRIEATK